MKKTKKKINYNKLLGISLCLAVILAVMVLIVILATSEWKDTAKRDFINTIFSIGTCIIIASLGIVATIAIHKEQ